MCFLVCLGVLYLCFDWCVLCFCLWFGVYLLCGVFGYMKFWCFVALGVRRLQLLCT